MKAGQIRETTSYVLVEVFRRFNFPQIARKFVKAKYASPESARAAASRWAEKNGVTLL